MSGTEAEIFRVVSHLLRARNAAGATPVSCRFGNGEGQLDMGLFVKALKVHGVSRHVLPALPALDIPAADAERLRQFVNQQVVNVLRQSLKVWAETRTALGLLEKAGLRVLVLKGCGLSQRLYGDPVRRPMNDCDLLVAPSDFAAAEKVLRDAGYQDMGSCVPMGPLQTSLCKFVYHDTTFTHPARKIRVELHWRLSNAVRDGEAAFERFYKRHERLDSDGGGLPVLAPADELPYLVAHGAIHDWCWLKWLVDLQAYFETVPEATFAFGDRRIARRRGPGRMRHGIVLVPGNIGGR